MIYHYSFIGNCNRERHKTTLFLSVKTQLTLILSLIVVAVVVSCDEQQQQYQQQQQQQQQQQKVLSYTIGSKSNDGNDDSLQKVTVMLHDTLSKSTSISTATTDVYHNNNINSTRKIYNDYNRNNATTTTKIKTTTAGSNATTRGKKPDNNQDDSVNNGNNQYNKESTNTNSNISSNLLYNTSSLASSTTEIQYYLDLLPLKYRQKIGFFKWNADGWLTNIILPIPKSAIDKQTWITSYYTNTKNVDINKAILYSFNKTSTSPYGKIAMLYVCDILSFVLQKPECYSQMDPPIPMLLYTVPQQQEIQISTDTSTSTSININNTTTSDGTNYSDFLSSSTSTWSIPPHLPILFDYADYNPCNTTTATTSTGTQTLISKNIIHIPNPYDYSGFNQRSIDKLIYDKEKDNKYLLNMTYDMFHQRSNVIIWRGRDHSEAIRHQLVSMSQEQEQQQQQDSSTNKVWLDAKFSTGEPIDNIETGAMSEEHMIKQYKYHLDVGGSSGTSWGGLRWKMCTGNLVFKVEASMIEWWYDTMQPYIHYIPVKDDLSNLYDQYKIIENNPQIAYTIAQNGQQVCLNTYTRYHTIQHIQPIIQSLQNASIQQMQEFDMLLLQQQQHSEHSDNT